MFRITEMTFWFWESICIFFEYYLFPSCTFQHGGRYVAFTLFESRELLAGSLAKCKIFWESIYSILEIICFLLVLLDIVGGSIRRTHLVWKSWRSPMDRVGRLWVYPGWDLTLQPFFSGSLSQVAPTLECNNTLVSARELLNQLPLSAMNSSICGDGWYFKIIPHLPFIFEFDTKI